MRYCILLVLFLATSVLAARVDFIPNGGQWAPQALYRADIAGGHVWLEQDGLRILYWETDSTRKIHDHARDPRFVIKFKAHVLKLTWVDANPSPTLMAGPENGGKFNYFLGKDPSKWASNLSAHNGVTYKDLYPGIDLEVTADENARLKYNLHVRPGADLSRVRLRYEGAEKVELLKNRLRIHTCLGVLNEDIPEAWYEEAGHDHKHATKAGYVLQSDGTVGFQAQPGTGTLVIDPSLTFSTYTGSTADNWGMTATYDHDGALYSGGVVAGYPGTTVLPPAGPYYDVTFNGAGNLAGVVSPALSFTSDYFIVKFSPDGQQREWATLVGGSQNEFPASMITNDAHDLFIMGVTLSSNFPMQGAYDNSFGGQSDLVVLRLNSTGSALLASTYLGGSSWDGLNQEVFGAAANPLYRFYADDARGEINLDGNDRVLITSSTSSSNYPVTAGAVGPTFGTANQNGVVSVLNANLSTLIASTYIGGLGATASYSIKVNKSGEYVIAGGTTGNNIPVPISAYRATHNGPTGSLNPSNVDGYLLHLNNSLTTVLGGTYIGTNGAYDQVYFIELDSLDHVYVLGQTQGNSFPVQMAAGETSIYSNANGRQFIARFNPAITQLEFSSRWGSGRATPDITPTAFLVDECSNIYATGWGGLDPFGGSSGNTNGLPTTADAVRTTTDGRDFYLFVLHPNGRALQYASFFGESNDPFFGSSDHVDGGTCRFDKTGKVYHAVCASCGGSNGFPTTANAWSRNSGQAFLGGNCNNAAFKFNFDLINLARPNFDLTLINPGCAPYTVNFDNNSTVTKPFFPPPVYRWHFGDTVTGAVNDFVGGNPTHIYTKPGRFQTRLIADYTGVACSVSDTTYQDIYVYDRNTPGLDVAFDTCNLGITLFNRSVGGTTFKWYFGSGPGDTINTDTSRMTVTHTYAAPGTYTVKLLVNPHSPCKDSIERVVTVGLFPSGTFNPTRNSCTRTYSFSNNVANSTSWQWNFGDPGSGANNTSTQQNPSHMFTNAGTYTVTLTAFPPGSKCSITRTQTVTVHSVTPILTLTNDTCTNSATVASASTGSITSTRLIINGTTYNATSQTVTFPTPGDYPARLEIRDPDNCLFTKDTIIKKRFTTDPNGNLNPTRQACTRTYGFTSTVTAAGTWQWNFGDPASGASNTSSLQNPSHNFSAPGTYTVTLRAKPTGRCFVDESVVVTVPGVTPVLTLTNDTCTNSATVASASTGSIASTRLIINGTTYNATSQTVTFPTPGDYPARLEVRDPDNCLFAKDTIIKKRFTTDPNGNLNPTRQACTRTYGFTSTVTAAGTWQWNFGDPASGASNTSSLQNPSHNFSAPGTYTVTLRAKPTGRCFVDESVVVTVPAPLVPVVQITGSNCTAPVIISSLSTGPITGTTWVINGQNYTGTTQSLQFNTAGTYNVRLRIEDADGCFVTKDTTFVKEMGPVSVGVLDHSRQNCTVVYTFDPNVNNGSYWDWDFGDPASGPGNTSNQQFPSHTYSAPGTYTVTLDATPPGHPCPVQQTATITVPDILVPRIETSLDPCEGTVFVSSAGSTGAIVSWLWQVGGDISSNPTAAFPLNGVGQFPVTLTLTDADGCPYSADTIVTLEFLQITNLRIPNVFSPNNDGINDRWTIEANNPVCLGTVMIFNRWGAKIYETKDLRTGWDGTYNGTPAPEGAYVYILQVQDLKRSGTVTLMR